jgi:putative membrane protein
MTATEPDYRFTLANERTFLAWIRTAFALVAGGVAARQLQDGASGTVISLGCMALACVLAGGAWARWRRIQRAMEREDAVPRPLLLPVVAAGTGLVAVCYAVFAVTA